MNILTLLLAAVLSQTPSATSPVCLGNVADPDVNVVQALGLTGSVFTALLASRDTAFAASVTACTNDWQSLTSANAARPVVPDNVVTAVDAIQADSTQQVVILDVFRAGVLQLLQPSSGIPAPGSIGGAYSAAASYEAGALAEDLTGTVYEALQATTGNSPSTSPTFWVPLPWTTTMRFVMEQIGF